MGIFARIENGVVAELIATEQDISRMFHAALHWVDASDTPGVSPGWGHDGESFSPPAEAAQPAPTPTPDAASTPAPAPAAVTEPAPTATPESTPEPTPGPTSSSTPTQG